MGSLSVTAFFASIILLYLSTFILCAIIRITTGVSIQRIGYFSLRRVAYAPRQGLHLAVRGLSVSLHRPSFAQPTYITLRLDELIVTVDPESLGGRSGSRKEQQDDVTDDSTAARPSTPKRPFSRKAKRAPENNTASQEPQSKTWRKLTDVKQSLKRLHKLVHWLTLVDIVATDTTFWLTNSGGVRVGSFSLAVDTRRKTIEQGKLFRHKKEATSNQQPAEWICHVRNIVLDVESREPVEMLDNLGLNVHGLLHKDVDGLRDVSVSVKTGKLHVPYDDLYILHQRVKAAQQQGVHTRREKRPGGVSFAAFVEELDSPGSREESIVRTVADSREFLSSILRGIQEIQLGISFFRASCTVESPVKSQKPIYLNIVTHELGVDLHKMDPSLPAHRMYFQRDDVAHQALLAAISLSVSIGDNANEHGKVMYIPMATTTVRTTLPSKTVTYPGASDAAERNTNVLFANLVATSPSVDLEPRQLSHIVNLLRVRRSNRPRRRNNHLLISRLLPKASIKLSVHEPVWRFVLPVIEDGIQNDYNMLVSSISSLSLDIESSHAPATHAASASPQYSLSSVSRVSSHQLYYQTTAGVKQRLLTTEMTEIKAHLHASNEVRVVGSGNLNTFSLHLVSGEVTRGVHQVVEQFYSHVHPTKLSKSRDASKYGLLRSLPPWLLEFQFECTDFSLEFAGIDERIGNTTRGMVLQLEGWTADYQAQRPEPRQRFARRRTPSHSTMSGDPSFRFPSNSPSRRSYEGPADGRRLAVHGRGAEGFIIESAAYMEPESFLTIPRFEVAISTSSDFQGPISHVNSVVREIHLTFSLYRYYAIGVAVCALQNAFSHASPRKRSCSDESASSSPSPSPTSSVAGSPRSGSADRATRKTELVTVDMKTHLVQVKCAMPSKPSMLLQMYGLVAGRHRWSTPFMRCHLVRLHGEAPKQKGAWARIVSVNNLRLGLRENEKKQAETFQEANGVDISTDFIRLAVPHHMIMHHIFDNIANTFKALQQLNHRFKTRTDEYVLKKAPVNPKKVPRISLRTKALLFEMEDDPFEWKLSNIYRLGMLEQTQRLAREEAHRMKMKKVDESRRRNVHLRTQGLSRMPTSPDYLRTPDSSQTSRDFRDRSPFRSPSRARRSRPYRYNKDKAPNFLGSHEMSRAEAWDELQLVNARSWKAKMRYSMRAQNTAMREMRRLAGAEQTPDGVESDENILAVPDRPAKLSVVISDFQLTIDKPSFPLEEYADYIHKIGKGMPLDMKYALLIPTSVHLEMGEARVHLRDYPLDLLHIPPLRPSQPPNLPSWSLSTDFVIAEEFRDAESQRHVKVNIVPPTTAPDGTTSPGFCVDVSRTMSPIKTYSNPTFEINTNLPTSISWGMSYQPVIQDVMKIFEGFSKPETDPSEVVGFWDKIRLNFHSRVSVVWKGDGDVHFKLKGSRDPYVVTGYGAGFVMVWRKDVQWDIHTSDDPREFMKVTSGEYVLAIPDYSHQARHTYGAAISDDSSTASRTATRDSTLFKKVIMKLSGNVRWLGGLVFERTGKGSERLFDFKPHYDVVLKNRKFVDFQKQPDYDAFRGFRSNHIHLSVAVVAPVTRVWSYSNLKPSASYNTVHLTPRFFTHFFSWWSLFSGIMSLPVRQGNLWPEMTKSSKKFSRHLGTVKYNLFLSPLFVAHVYKHKDIEDFGENMVTATGLKVHLDSFMLDLHQRRELVIPTVRGRSKQTKASVMKINRAHLDFISADCRAVSAMIAGTDTKDACNISGEIAPDHQPAQTVDLSRFTIPDQDFNWVDVDDFVELDWIIPSDSNPQTRILPLAYSPRFSYFRRTDHDDTGPNEPGYSPFGDEPTHHCVMSQDNDPRRVQMELIKQRLKTLDAQIASHNELVGEHELQIVREGYADEGSGSEYELFRKQGESLQKRKEFLEAGLRRLEKLLSENDETEPKSSGEHSPTSENLEESTASASTSTKVDADIDSLYASSSDEFVSDYMNRFIIHNIQLKWNNSLRDIILRYIHQVNQRRGFVYYMSRRAIKFMLDIVEEQRKSKMNAGDKNRGRHSTFTMSTEDTKGSSDGEDEASVQDRIEQLLHDANKFVNADEPPGRDRTDKSDAGSRPPNRTEDIAPEFTAQNSYHLRLIAPQIQLQSEKKKKSVALLAAKGMQLKVVSIMDKNRVSDAVSGLVQRQFTLDMDSAQFFVAMQKTFASHLHIYCGNRYGNPPGVSWPPWVSVESVFDFNLDTPGFARIIEKTSASLRYDKFNTLRLKYNEKVAAHGDDEKQHSELANESRIDQISLEFPHVRAVCDSDQYYSMYIIALDLLLYSEPLEQVRSEKLEKIMLATDFSDLRGAPEMVSRLQQRIRHLEDIKAHFQIQAEYLDKQGCKDRMHLERDLATCEDELFFIMKAITTSQRRNEERAKSQSSGFMRWSVSASEIVWHLMKDRHQTLVEFQLRDAAYERTDNIDGSNHNTIEVQRISGLNLLPNALYPEMIAPYLDDQRQPMQNEKDNMLRVDWYMLEAISGIPVVNSFEVSLFPLKIQLERELGKKLFEYIFPGIGSNAFENGSFSPFMIKHMPIGGDESDSDDEGGNQTPAKSTASVSGDEAGVSHDVLQSRLMPTLRLPEKRKTDSSSRKGNDLGMSAIDKEASQRAFRSHGSTASMSSMASLSKKKKDSGGSMHLMTRRPSDKSFESQQSSDAAKEEKSSKFSLSSRRTAQKSNKPSDDLTQMMSRAANFMILTHVKINDVVLCLSYKGKADRNLEDIHDFVFRLPVLEYRNKSWSNLDLALRLKKDAIKALISHAPAILGNKFSHNRPSKQHQRRLRELATSSQALNASDISLSTRNRNMVSSDSASSPASRDSESPRPSFNSATSVLSRTRSNASSLQQSARPGSMASRGRQEGGKERRPSAPALVANGDAPSDSPQTDSSYDSSDKQHKRLSLGRRFLR